MLKTFAGMQVSNFYIILKDIIKRWNYIFQISFGSKLKPIYHITVPLPSSHFKSVNTSHGSTVSRAFFFFTSCNLYFCQKIFCFPSRSTLFYLSLLAVPLRQNSGRGTRPFFFFFLLSLYYYKLQTPINDIRVKECSM